MIILLEKEIATIRISGRVYKENPENKSVNSVSYLDKPVFSDHIKQDLFWLFRQVVAYCCMKVVQKAPVFCATLFQQ